MGIKSLIKRHRRIMFDTAPIVYFIEEHKVFGRLFRIKKEVRVKSAGYSAY